jgi:hypothetical protein
LRSATTWDLTYRSILHYTSNLELSPKYSRVIWMLFQITHIMNPALARVLISVFSVEALSSE